MTLNIVDVQEVILAHFRDNTPWYSAEQAIPDIHNLRRGSNGSITPYIAIQFGDLQRRGGGDTLVGVRTYDYELPIYVQAVASTPKVAREVAYRNVIDTMLGFKTDYTGEIRKRPGGAMWPITESSGATEAYLFPVSFAVTVQLMDK